MLNIILAFFLGLVAGAALIVGTLWLMVYVIDPEDNNKTV